MLAKLPGALKQNFIQQMFLSSPEHQRKGILAWFDITHQLIREHVFLHFAPTKNRLEASYKQNVRQRRKPEI